MVAGEGLFGERSNRVREGCRDGLSYSRVLLRPKSRALGAGRGKTPIRSPRAFSQGGSLRAEALRSMVTSEGLFCERSNRVREGCRDGLSYSRVLLRPKSKTPGRGTWDDPNPIVVLLARVDPCGLRH